MDIYVGIASVLIALFALGVAVLSWRSSLLAVRASTYDQRYKIYEDAEQFLGAWMRDARPDMDMLSTLTGAWSRSHFLCSEHVTRYLRKVWLDAIRANHLRRIIANEVPGDRDKAIEDESALLLEHTDYDRLRAVFMPDLKVQPGSIFERLKKFFRLSPTRSNK